MAEGYHSRPKLVSCAVNSVPRYIDTQHPSTCGWMSPLPCIMHPPSARHHHDAVPSHVTRRPHGPGCISDRRHTRPPHRVSQAPPTASTHDTQKRVAHTRPPLIRPGRTGRGARISPPARELGAPSCQAHATAGRVLCNVGRWGPTSPNPSWSGIMGTLTRVPILVPCRRVLLVVMVWAEGGGPYPLLLTRPSCSKGGEAKADSMVRKSLWYSLAASFVRLFTLGSWPLLEGILLIRPSGNNAPFSALCDGL